MKKRIQFRQGDVFLERIDSIPAAATEKERDAGRVVLAYGEVTGHAHAIMETNATLLSLLTDGAEEFYLKADGSVTLRHEEHAPIDLPGGSYRIIHQREYHPEEIRRVLD